MDKHAKKQEKQELERRVEMTVCSVFNELCFEQKLCDVCLKVEGDEFYAHKIILCGCSQYFRSLFTSDRYPADKREFSFPHISCEMMELILEYVYTQCVNLTEENVCKLLITANYLAMDELVNECSAFLKAQLCAENCLGTWKFARFYACPKLEQQAFQFIMHNFEETVRVSEDFKDLTVEQLSEIMGNDQLNLKEESAGFEAIIHWIEHVPLQRKAHIDVLLPKVRLALLNRDYLKGNIRHNTFVADSVVCKKLIKRVLRCMDGLIMNRSLGTELTQPRLPSTVLLAIGGQNRDHSTNAIEAYNTRAKLWARVRSNDEHPRANHGTVFLNGFVYCVGGTDDEEYFNTVRRFDPITRTWAQVSPMHCRRGYVSVCVLDGQIYAMGGLSGYEELRTVERYDPEYNQWIMLAPMHAQRSNASAAVLDGKVYMCGGYDGNECLCTAEYYSPQTDQWTLISPMMSPRKGLGAIAYDGQVYAVGGYDGLSHLNSAERYDPHTNSWSKISDMTTQRRNFGIEVVDNLLLVAGGKSVTTTTTKVEVYDKKTDEWYQVQDLNVPRSGLACCVISGLPNLAEYAAPRDKVPQSLGRSIITKIIKSLISRS